MNEGIELAIEPLFSEVKNIFLEDKTKTLRDSFDKMVNEYEQDGQKILTIINSTIKPEFKDWKEEIELALRPYIVS